MKREPKKTDFLEIRLSWETKRALMTRCRENGVSASRLVREWIDRYLHNASRAPTNWKEELRMIFTGQSPRRRAALGGLAALGTAAAAGMIALPASAATDPRLAAVFDWTDRDNDARISPAEFFGDQTPVEPAPRAGEPEALTLIVDSKVAPAPGETREALFARLDANRDGSLSLGEFADASIARTIATPAVAGADANNDGLLTEGELAAFASARRAAAGDKDAVAAGSMLARGVILDHDRDGDGQVPVKDLVGR